MRSPISIIMITVAWPMRTMLKELIEALCPLWGVDHPSYHPPLAQPPSPTSGTSHDPHSFPTPDHPAPRCSLALMYTPYYLLLPVTLLALASCFSRLPFDVSLLISPPPFMAPRRGSIPTPHRGRDRGHDPSH